MRGTAGENPFVVLDSPGKSALLMTEQLRLQERFRVLGKVEGDEVAGETLDKASLLFIEGNEAVLNQKTGKMKVTGNSRVKQDKTFLVADVFDISSKNGKMDNYTATGNVKITDKKEGYTILAGKLDYYKELGYTRITKGYTNLGPNPVLQFTNKNVTATSLLMEKYDKEDKANLLGNVVINQGAKKAYAKWGEYFVKKKKMYLRGNPVLVDGKSKFNSFKINIDVTEETMTMVGKGSGFYEYKK